MSARSRRAANSPVSTTSVGAAASAPKASAVRDAEDRTRRHGVRVAPGRHLRCVVHHGAHGAGRHGHVVERGSVIAQRGDGGRGSLVHGDVVRMPVETIFTKSDHDIGAEPLNRIANVGLELFGIRPGQHPVFVVEDRDLFDAEDAGGIPELRRADVAGGRRPARDIRVVHLSVFPVCDREQRHAHAERGAPRQQPAARERLVVRVGEHRQQYMRSLVHGLI